MHVCACFEIGLYWGLTTYCICAILFLGGNNKPNHYQTGEIKMNAQETILNYVASHNDTDIDNKQLFVQMMTDGMVISQLPKIVAHAKRIGKEIIVTETTYSQTQVLKSPRYSRYNFPLLQPFQNG